VSIEIDNTARPTMGEATEPYLPSVDAATLEQAQASLGMLAPDAMMQLMVDVGRARELLDGGKKAAAAKIVERYRPIAVAAGMEAALDAILADLA
jgi:hypothetical protein